MSSYRLEVRVTPRPGLLDPEGAQVHHALESLGFEAVSDVRFGKAIAIDLEAASEEDALAAGEEMCRKLLANPVTEDFAVSVEALAAEATGS